MSLLPQEHGAYGQMSVPLVTAFAVAGPSVSGALTAFSVVAGFLAHEPLLILIGRRGPRARREVGPRAMRWLLGWGIAALAAGVAGIVTAPADARWSFLLPLVPAAWLAVAIAKGREKTWQGEAAAAVAFSLTVVPVCLAGGVPITTALTVAIPFALMSVSAILAVRAIILRVRGGGQTRATAMMRTATIALAVIAGAALAASAAGQLLGWGVFAASAPGLVAAATIAMMLPPPAKLRTIGWTLVAVSLLTATLVIVAAA